jgi:hypothetical protein
VFLNGYRLESALRSSSRPVLHGAVRIVQELGKSRAAAVAVRGYVDDMVQTDTSMENPTADAMKADDDAGDAEGCLLYYYVLFTTLYDDMLM